MSDNDWGDVIANEARQWEGHDYYPGVKEQCMNWVREVLARIKHPYADRVTKEPVDGHWTGPALASSLAGRDLGQMVTSIPELEPGDIVFWNDTYYTGFPAGTITHVGIALNNTRFIHRNTMAAPVNVQPFHGIWLSNFRCALRVPQQIKPDPKVQRPDPAIPVESRVWANTNGVTLDLKEPLPPGRYALVSSGGNSDGAWVVKYVSK